MQERFGNLIIEGSNRRIGIRYAKPDWSKDQLPYFMYQGTRHYLANFMRSMDKEIAGFRCDGYMADSAFSGVAVKLVDYEGDQYVQAYSVRAVTYS